MKKVLISGRRGGAFAFAVALLLSLSASCVLAGSRSAAPFAKGERVTMLGDSITHGGKYCVNLQLFWSLRFPGDGVRIMNCGVSGGTAGGGIERWERDVMSQNADRIFVMFGMNDVGGGPYNEQAGLNAAARYETNMTEIAKRTIQAGKRLAVIMPTPYDEYSTNRKARCVKERDSAGLARLAQMCRALADKNNAELIDLYTPLVRFVKDHGEFPFCRDDRVHPTAEGHIVMTAEILSQMGVSPFVAQVEIDAASACVKKSESAGVSDLKTESGRVSFVYAPERLPFPTAPEYKCAAAVYPVSEKMNLEMLQVKALPAGNYRLLVDGKELARFSAEEFAKGVNLALLPTKGASLAMEAWDVSRKLATSQVRLRTLVQLEGLAKRRGAELSDNAGVIEKIKEFIEDLRRRKSTALKYYENQLVNYQRDKPLEQSLRNQEEHWRRLLSKASAKTWKAEIVIEPVL